MIPKSVEMYRDECATILSWLSADSWLHQDDFDRKSFEWRHRPGPRQVPSFNEDTIVLPIHGDPLLAILREFQMAGTVVARERDGEIEYRLAEEKKG
jgi:hypothetical protein